jgi:hypothetical protein
VWVPPLLDAELYTRRIRVRERDVVFVKGIFEASEGLGAVFAAPREDHEHPEDGGVLTIAVPHSRARELDELLADLKAELGNAFWFIDY